MTPTPAEILSSPASSYRGWRLHVRCGQCHNYSILELHRLSDRLQALTVDDVIKRQPSSVEIRHHMISAWLVGDASDL
jgi:hypothetical protein